MYLQLDNSCNKLLGVECINLDSPMSKKSSNKQIDTCLLIIKLNKS